MGKSEYISTPVAEANLSACHLSHQVLFEPVQIGPVTAPNRFYQVPHASGMTETHPRVRAAFRETKAEGGWGVVSTGAVSIHPSSDDSPLPFFTFELPVAIFIAIFSCCRSFIVCRSEASFTRLAMSSSIDSPPGPAPEGTLPTSGRARAPTRTRCTCACPRELEGGISSSTQ